jgi:predicted dehydrogenase
MIRLAVSGVDETIRREVAARLRGAVLSEEYDAAVFLGPAADNEVERLLTAGKSVLLTVGSLPERLPATGRLAVVNPDRYLPSRQLVRQQLDTGKLGEVGLVRLHRWQPAVANGSGLLRDLDLLLWLVNKLPERAYAVAASSFVQVHLGFPGGGMALLDHFTGLPPGDGYTSLSVIGSTGAACADDHHNSQLLYAGGSARTVQAGEGNQYLATLVQEFVDALHTGRDLSASVADWRRVLAVRDAVNRALTSRQAIALEGR